MSTSSSTVDAWARKIERAMLQRLASVGQAHIAAQLGVNESTVSRWKDGEIARWARLLALLGLKATPQEFKCMDEDTINALIVLGGQRMKQIKSADHLVFEDDE